MRPARVVAELIHEDGLRIIPVTTAIIEKDRRELIEEAKAKVRKGDFIGWGGGEAVYGFNLREEIATALDAILKEKS